MSLATFNAIRALLNSSKIQPVNQAVLRIEEKSKSASMKLIDIDGVGANAFSIKYDECGFPGQNLFAPHPELHRGCDSVAFCELEGQPYILCFELKSSEPTRHDVAQQFRSAQCFLEYLETLLKTYHSVDSISQWQRRYYVFHNQAATPLSKRTSHDSYDNTTPEKALFIAANTGAKTYLRYLLGKPL